MNTNQKEQLIEKIVELVALLGIQGEFTDDGQSCFIAQSVMVVMTAAGNPEHAKLLNKHLKNFVNEANFMDGRTEAKEFFTEMERCSN